VSRFQLVLFWSTIDIPNMTIAAALVASFPGIKAYLPDAGDAARWDALGMRCRQPRGARGIREVSIRFPNTGCVRSRAAF
jgi:hypothetical protein